MLAARWLLCAAAAVAVASDTEEAPTCTLEPLPDPKAIFALLDKHLVPQHSKELKSLCEDPRAAAHE